MHRCSCSQGESRTWRFTQITTEHFVSNQLFVPLSFAGDQTRCATCFALPLKHTSITCEVRFHEEERVSQSDEEFS